MVETKLMPAEGRYVKVRGLTIYYETFGSGGPLVLVHGGTVNARRMWEKCPIFSGRYKVITPDSRGHGKTDNPTEAKREAQIPPQQLHSPSFRKTTTKEPSILFNTSTTTRPRDR